MVTQPQTTQPGSTAVSRVTAQQSPQSSDQTDPEAAFAAHIEEAHGRLQTWQRQQAAEIGAYRTQTQELAAQYDDRIAAIARQARALAPVGPQGFQESGITGTQPAKLPSASQNQVTAYAAPQTANPEQAMYESFQRQVTAIDERQQAEATRFTAQFAALDRTIEQETARLNLTGLAGEQAVTTAG